VSTDNAWQRSSFCSDHTCVEVAWRTASTSGACVEVGREGDRILVRDSKHPEQQPLAFTRTEWDVFLAGVEAGQFRDL
jgi:hypothetical protein